MLVDLTRSAGAVQPTAHSWTAGWTHPGGTTIGERVVLTAVKDGGAGADGRSGAGGGGCKDTWQTVQQSATAPCGRRPAGWHI